jgi:hypothetical protein
VTAAITHEIAITAAAMPPSVRRAAGERALAQRWSSSTPRITSSVIPKKM